MKKGKIHLGRLLFSAVVGMILFYIIANATFLNFWKFNLLSGRHWAYIYRKWQNGWVIHKPKDVAFLLALLFLLPGFLMTWFGCYIFPLKKILRSPFDKYRQKVKAKQAAEMAKKFEEQVLAKQNEKKEKKEKKESSSKVHSKELQHIDQLRGKTDERSHSSSAQGTAASHTEASDAPETVNTFELWNDLVASLEKENLFVLRQMKIKDIPVNTLVVTQDAIFYLCEGPADTANWTADEDATPPVWKTEKGDIPSPLQPLIQIRETLSSYFKARIPKCASLTLNGVMILDHGNLTNMEALLPYLEKYDLSMLRMGTCKTSVLPDTAALIEYIKTQPASSHALNDAVSIAILDLMKLDDDN